MELQAQVRCRSAYVVGCLCMYVGVCVYTQTGPQCAIVQQGLVLTCLLGSVLTCILLQCAIVQQQCDSSMAQCRLQVP